MSQHKELRAAIENTVHKMQDDIFFYYGEESDFDLKVVRAKEGVLVNLAPLTAQATYADNNVLNYSKSWTVAMAWYKRDKQSNQKYGDILDITDGLIDRFVNKLNLQENMMITSISQLAFIKALDTLTGHLLTLTVTLTDNFEYCEDC